MIIQGPFSDSNIPQGIYCVPPVRGYNGTSLCCAVQCTYSFYFVQAVFKKTSTERKLCVCGARDGTPRHGR